VALFVSSAHAQPQPSASDFATARTALKEGLALREKGEIEAAAARMQTAYDLVKTPVTAFELGKTQLLLGRVLTAHELFQVVVRMPAALEESTRSAAARSESARLAADIEPRIPVLRIHVKLAPGTTAIVHLDDEQIHTTGDVTERAVDPGKHELVAKSGDGPEEKMFVEVKESEKKDVEIAPTWVPPKPPPPPPEREIVYVRQTNPLVVVGFVGSAVSFVVAGISLFEYTTYRSRALDACGRAYCPQHIVDHERNIAGGWGFAALVSGGGTAAFFMMGIIALNRPIRERVNMNVHPTVGLGSVGLEGSF
jgi:hypothetical protein